MSAVQKGGTTAVTIGLTTPGVRIATVPAEELLAREAFAEWADASCPVCIAIALTRQNVELRELATPGLK